MMQSTGFRIQDARCRTGYRDAGIFNHRYLELQLGLPCRVEYANEVDPRYHLFKMDGTPHFSQSSWFVPWILNPESCILPNQTAMAFNTINC